MINILIRSHAREQEFKACIDSVKAQIYQDIHLIVSVDDDQTEEHTVKTLSESGLSHEIVKVAPSKKPFYWNLYCNTLKSEVHDGWFFYLDSDDKLTGPRCLHDISKHLTDPDTAVICQFLRKGKRKPDFINPGLMTSEQVIRGKIGGSCIFLHHSQKEIAFWDGERAADYRFIKQVSEKIPMTFVPIPVVSAENNGRRGQ